MLDLELYEKTLWLQKYKPETLAIILKQLNIAQENIINFIGTTENKAKIKAFINQEIENAFSTFETIIQDDVKEISILAYFATGKILSDYVSDGLAKEFSKLKNPKEQTLKRINQTNISIFGNSLSDEKKRILSGAKNSLNTILTEGVRQGLSTNEMRKQVQNTLAISRNQADAITRTVTLQSLAKSQEEIADFFKDEIIEYYYNGISDTRQTNYCRLRTGITSKNKEDIVKMLYSHFRCRSILGFRTELSQRFEQDSRLVTEWNQKKINARSGGTYTKFTVDKVIKIDKNATPTKIFNTFSKENQIDILGKQRYKLWKENKIPFEKLFDDSQKDLIPLNELKKRL